MKTNDTLPLSDPQASLDTVGGKGESLSQLVQAGFPVPDGFHVTTAAYRRFVELNDLLPGILAALEAVERARPQTLEAASRLIFDLFARASIPDDVASVVVGAYSVLPGSSGAGSPWISLWSCRT